MDKKIHVNQLKARYSEKQYDYPKKTGSIPQPAFVSQKRRQVDSDGNESTESEKLDREILFAAKKQMEVKKEMPKISDFSLELGREERKPFDPESVKLLRLKDLGNNVIFQEFSEVNGGKVWDIRYYYMNKPTKKGIRLRKDQLEALFELFE